MKLSMNVISMALSDDVVYKHISQDAQLSISRYVAFDPDLGFTDPGTVVICPLSQLPDGSTLSDGTNIVCFGDEFDLASFNMKGYGHTNMVVCASSSESKILNHIIDVFDSYRRRFEDVRLFIAEGKDLGSIIDQGAKLIGAPLCIMDMNYNVLAISRTVTPRNDRLWSYLEKGYGARFKDVTQRSEPSLNQVADSPNGYLETINNISMQPLCLQTLYRRGMPIAVIAMHYPDEVPAAFHRGQKQLFKAFVELLTSNMEMFKDVQISRSNKKEQFFLELLLDGSFDTEDECRSRAEELGLTYDAPHLLGIVYSKKDINENDAHLLIDYIQAYIPECVCVALGFKVYVMFEADTGVSKWDKQRRRFEVFLETYQCKWLVGSPYYSYMGLHNVRVQMDEAIAQLATEDDAPVERHYASIAHVQAVRHFLKDYPYMTLCHPMLRKLKQYDKDSKTDLLGTFRTLLENNCSVADASVKMNLHRNSMHYRIRRIRSIVGDEFVDKVFEDFRTRFSLLFSFICEDFWVENNK